MAKYGAGIRKRPDGLLEKKFSVKGVRYSVYGHNRADLAAREDEKRKQIAENAVVAGKKQTLSQYFTKWIDSKRSNVKPTTIRLYTTHYNIHIKPVLGDQKLCDLRREHIIRMMEKARKEKSAYCANYCLMIMKQILNQAEQDEVILRNVAEAVKRLPDRRAEKAVDGIHKALSVSEQSAFLEEIQGDYYEQFYKILILTGMRCGEAAALTWEDIDFRKELIRINKTVTQAEDGKAVIGDSAKTEKSTRTILLDEAIKQCLSRQRKMIAEIYGLDWVKGEKRVFPSLQGKLILPSTMNCHLSRICTRLGIERRTVHSLRDSFATRFIEADGSPQILKSLLGHTSYSMTMDRYSQVMDEVKASEMQKVKII